MPLYPMCIIVLHKSNVAIKYSSVILDLQTGQTSSLLVPPLVVAVVASLLLLLVALHKYKLTMYKWSLQLKNKICLSLSVQYTCGQEQQFRDRLLIPQVLIFCGPRKQVQTPSLPPFIFLKFNLKFKVNPYPPSQVSSS